LSPLNTEAGKSRGVTAVERALAILDGFIGDGSRSLAELARLTGLAKPTILRSLVSLEKAGYVVRLEGGRYQLGAKTVQLATAYKYNFKLEQHVLPILKQLTEETLESAAFHIREKNNRLCLFRIDSPQVVRDVSQRVAPVPLDMTSTGRVLATAAWPESRDQSPMPAPVFVSSGVFDVLTASISTPVFGIDRALIGALTVSGPAQRFGQADIRAMALALVRAAHRLSLTLGAPMPPLSGKPNIVPI
jgi:DNA-binding IclR family transcriptional regulator